MNIFNCKRRIRAILAFIVPLAACLTVLFFSAEADAAGQPEAPAAQASEVSPFGQLLEGSFLGSLFYGYPYQGIGLLDVAALAVLALLIFRVFYQGRRNAAGSDDNRFSVDRRGDSPHTPDRRQDQDPSGSARTGWPGKNADADDANKAPGRNRVRPEDLRPPLPHERQSESNNPRDNPWSRRLGQKDEPERGSGLPGRPPMNGHGNVKKPQAGRQGIKEQAAAAWREYSSEPKRAKDPEAAVVARGARVPDRFDVPDFLEGARALFVRLQKAWAARSLDDLSAFVTPEMLELLRMQAAASPEPGIVEVALVNAVLEDVLESGGNTTAFVRFDSLIYTGPSRQPSKVDERWTFVRGPESGGMWRLAGIKSGGD